MFASSLIASALLSLAAAQNYVIIANYDNLSCSKDPIAAFAIGSGECQSLNEVCSTKKLTSGECTLIRSQIANGTADAGFRFTCTPEGAKTTFYADNKCLTNMRDLTTFAPDVCFQSKKATCSNSNALPKLAGKPAESQSSGAKEITSFFGMAGALGLALL
jgi:hypothetical protein